MFVVVVYDVETKRLPEVEKFLKRYLSHVQLSVFEGELSERLLKEVIEGLRKIISEDDSVKVYVFERRENVEVLCYGRCKSEEKVL